MHITFTIYAQGEIDAQPKVFYRNEQSFAFLLNSNGWGLNFRYGKRLDAFNKRLYEIDFAYIKHPKEARTYSTTNSGAKFVYGKMNLAFDFRFSLGKQHEIFRKQDVGGIAIRYFYNFGPSIALLKPIYYNLDDVVPREEPDGTGGTVIKYYLVPREEPERYDPDWRNVGNVVIDKRASFFRGFGDLSVVPGAFAKFGFNFEYSKQDRVIHAIEAGVILEGFAKELTIMDVAKNQQVFFTLFVSYRIGRIVDPYEVKKKREKAKSISY